jgi:hypothetical protein
VGDCSVFRCKMMRKMSSHLTRPLHESRSCSAPLCSTLLAVAHAPPPGACLSLDISGRCPSAEPLSRPPARRGERIGQRQASAIKGGSRSTRLFGCRLSALGHSRFGGSVVRREAAADYAPLAAPAAGWLGWLAGWLAGWPIDWLAGLRRLR